MSDSRVISIFARPDHIIIIDYDNVIIIIYNIDMTRPDHAWFIAGV